MAKMGLQEGEIRYNAKPPILVGTRVAQSEKSGLRQRSLFMQAWCYANTLIRHLLLCSAPQPDHSPCPLLMSADARLEENRAGQEMFGHLCILKEQRTPHLAKKPCSFWSNGWVGLPRKKTFLVYRLGCANEQYAGQGNRKVVKWPKQVDVHVLVHKQPVFCLFKQICTKCLRVPCKIFKGFLLF